MYNIDVNFDFTIDTPNYWKSFWEKDDLLGCVGNDPDSMSKTLQRYHQLLWSKELPIGKKMQLEAGTGKSYLKWGDFRFGSDSIITSFRYKGYRKILEKLSKNLPEYHSFMENFLHKAYTVGGIIIFPKRTGGINQSRGCNIYVKDRWDLTLECIRLYYLGESSPLYDVLLKEKDFFDLFVNFIGYVDFFFLQDCVSPDYKQTRFWLGNNDFIKHPLPQNTEEYLMWINNELEFVKKRNDRIQNFLNSHI